MEDNEITIHSSKEDMSIIVADKTEANQLIWGEIEDSKPSSTSTPKRMAMEDQGPPKKKQTLEDDGGQNDEKIIIDATKDKIKEIKLQEV